MIGNNFDPSGHVGMIELTYTVGNGACLAQQSHSIEVGMMPNANAGTDATVCGNEVVPVSYTHLTLPTSDLV